MPVVAGASILIIMYILDTLRTTSIYIQINECPRIGAERFYSMSVRTSLIIAVTSMNHNRRHNNGHVYQSYPRKVSVGCFG